MTTCKRAHKHSLILSFVIPLLHYLYYLLPLPCLFTYTYTYTATILHFTLAVSLSRYIFIVSGIGPRHNRDLLSALVSIMYSFALFNIHY